MARSTFEGPILSGDNRFGPFRNVGYADLAQSVGMNIPPVVQTIPADTATNVYRGVVFYLPTGCDFDGINVDCQTVVGVAGGSASLTSATVLVSNNWTVSGGTPTYFATGAISAVGRQALSTFTATQITNQTNTSTDIVLPNGQPNLSQVVVTLVIVGTGLDTRTSLTGGFSFFVRYLQNDPNIGNFTTYPYGNFD